MNDVRRISLGGRDGRGLFALIDAGDAPLISAMDRSWFYRGKAGNRYVYAKYHGQAVRLHRVIMGAVRGQRIDHVNGDTLDNRRSNLRYCDQTQNNGNRKPNRGLTVKGVQKRPGRDYYTARIQFHGKRIHLGNHATEELAVRAYDQAALHYFGEFARPNQLKAA